MKNILLIEIYLMILSRILHSLQNFVLYFQILIAFYINFTNYKVMRIVFEIGEIMMEISRYEI